MSYITFENVCKDYPAGDSVVHAADHVSFGIEKGELWSREINRSIQDCEAIIVFASKTLFAYEDTYVRKEFRIARGYGRKVNVVWLDDVAFGDVHTGIKDWFVDVEDLQGIRAVGLTAEQTAQRMISGNIRRAAPANFCRLRGACWHVGAARRCCCRRNCSTANPTTTHWIR